MTKKHFEGKVVSAKMQKTVVVAVELPKRHPIYNKNIRNTRRFKARNDMGAKLGDYVLIEETRPFSKEVTWAIIKVAKQGETLNG